MAADKLAIEDVRHSFTIEGRPPLQVLGGVDVAVRENEFVAIIGPSGSGKSTLFNAISGLLRPQQGRIAIDGKDVTGKAGQVAYMMQRDLLLQWRTVLDNVTLGSEIAGRPKAASRTQARDLMRRFGLDGFENFYPSALSGGMRQRAALMRTILCDRPVMLLDEPFGALDALTRAAMQEWLLDIWHDFRRTVLLITHDPEEAVFLADRVYVVTSRPMCIKGIIEIDLPRPRTHDVTASLEFAQIKHEVLRLVREEDNRSRASERRRVMTGELAGAA